MTINVEIAKEARHIIRTHLEDHEEIRVVLAQTAPSSFGLGANTSSSNDSNVNRSIQFDSSTTPNSRTNKQLDFDYSPDYASESGMRTTSSYSNSSPVVIVEQIPENLAELQDNRRWVPTPLFGPPTPTTRPPNPRQSDTDQAERPVIVDDGRGVREEYRRPRKSRNYPASSLKPPTEDHDRISDASS